MFISFSFVFFFFFKQKTAYEMRISDWSSDVCSSDLLEGVAQVTGGGGQRVRHPLGALIDRNGLNERPELLVECPLFLKIELKCVFVVGSPGEKPRASGGQADEIG